MRMITVTVFLLTLPYTAKAQSLGTPMAMPMVVDLAKVEVGTFADYVMSTGAITLQQRWALVARDKKTRTIELTTQAAMLAKPMIVRLSLSSDPLSKVKAMGPAVIQVGTEDPMTAPKDYPEPKFQVPERQNLVGEEEIKVIAGTFKTLHYRESGAGGTVDIWINEDIPPIGLVKVVNTPETDPSPGMKGASMSLELSNTGKGQKPVITKKPRAFDEKRLQGLTKTQPTDTK